MGACSQGGPTTDRSPFPGAACLIPKPASSQNEAAQVVKGFYYNHKGGELRIHKTRMVPPGPGQVGEGWEADAGTFQNTARSTLDLG